MSVPTIIFIDTSIFDESMYNFESASMVAFKDSVADAQISLLMPDSTLREIQRHMKEKASTAVTALEKAAHKAPFLRTLPHWPLTKKEPSFLKYELGKIVSKQFESFIDLFKLIKLDYNGIDIKQIMDWYDTRMAPFSERKKGEFPDAFAVAAIEQYRVDSDSVVAVISKDADFKKACERFIGLMYFPSLAAYSEALKSKDKRLATIQANLHSERARINDAINESFVGCEFTIEANWEGYVSDVEITNFESIAFHVMGIGQNTYTVVFEGEIEYSAHVSYDDLESATYEKGEPIMIHHTIEGVVTETAEIQGVIKMQFADEELAIDEIKSVILDQTDFSLGSEYY